MSTDATAPAKATAQSEATVQPVGDKGKGKGKAPAQDVSMEESDDDDDEESDEENEQTSEEEEEEDDMNEIDPQAILGGGRRTRGVKVDYNSAEALKKAGLEKTADEEDEEDEDVKMKE